MGGSACGQTDRPDKIDQTFLFHMMTWVSDPYGFLKPKIPETAWIARIWESLFGLIIPIPANLDVSVIIHMMYLVRWQSVNTHADE